MTRTTPQSLKGLLLGSVALLAMGVFAPSTPADTGDRVAVCPPTPNSPVTCHLIDSFTSADADTRAQGDRQETQAVVPEGATACDALPAPRQSVKARGTEGVRGGGAQPPAYEARSQRNGRLLLAQVGAGACASCARRQTACHAECQAQLTVCEVRMIPGGVNCEGIYNACVSDCDTAAETCLASCGR